MKVPDDTDIYNLFRAGLTNTDHVNDDSDENWGGMEDLLEGTARKRTSIIWLYRVAAGIAAMFILYFGLQLIKPAVPQRNIITKAPVPAPSKLPGGIVNNPSHKTTALTKEIIKQKINPTESLYTGTLKKQRQNDSQIAIASDTTNVGNNHDANAAIQKPAIIPGVDPNKTVPDSLINKSTLAAANTDTASNAAPVVKDKKSIKIIKRNGPGFTLAVLAAPDFNGVNSFNGGKTGGGFSLQLSLKLTKKLSISSGATYVIKPYKTSFSNYKSSDPQWWARKFSTNKTPENFTANCEVLDIPLNINYQLFDKGRNSFAIGSGLSSYFMLREDFSFNFADPAKAPRKFGVSNQNQHLLGVLNFNVTYQHQVNNNLGIVLQPYIKLPLTQIGFGQVDLKSTGVAVGFSWNISSAKNR